MDHSISNSMVPALSGRLCSECCSLTRVALRRHYHNKAPWGLSDSESPRAFGKQSLLQCVAASVRLRALQPPGLVVATSLQDDALQVHETVRVTTGRDPWPCAPRLSRKELHFEGWSRSGYRYPTTWSLARLKAPLFLSQSRRYHARQSAGTRQCQACSLSIAQSRSCVPRRPAVLYGEHGRFEQSALRIRCRYGDSEHAGNHSL